MQSDQEQGLSLHRLLQLSAATPEYVQVKPKGFKAILQSTVEFLEAHNIQAHLLVKLPAGETWHEDVQRYSQSLVPPYRVWRFLRVDVGQPLSPSTSQDISLGAGYPWPGDYFVVVQAESFGAMVVAHRMQ
ncbi:MAG: DICT sensory domain-containing protein, partial [Cyanobacteria bacterium J06638_6]